MPLTRSMTNPALATPRGVEFTLKDRSKLFRCLVTKQALEKLARGDLETAQFARTFHRHHERIEQVASRKYHSASRFRPPFTISASDLIIYRVPAPLGQTASKLQQVP